MVQSESIKEVLWGQGEKAKILNATLEFLTLDVSS